MHGSQGCTYKAYISLSKVQCLDLETPRTRRGNFQTDLLQGDEHYGFSVFFSRPVCLEKDVKYVISASIVGPQSHHGVLSRGSYDNSCITITSDEVNFRFYGKNASGQYIGTRNEKFGQFARILFR